MLDFSFLPLDQSRELLDDLREVFAELAATLGDEHRAYSGEYHPSLDVVETDTAVEIVVDLAGVPVQAIRVLFRGDVLVIAGEKAPGAPVNGSSFHLLERGFGRFARAVRLSGAFEISQAKVTLASGELTIVLPKRTDRRGRPQRIPVTPPTQKTA